jgi:hypothetical protein
MISEVRQKFERSVERSAEAHQEKMGIIPDAPCGDPNRIRTESN